jgi:hypothetical protein
MKASKCPRSYRTVRLDDVEYDVGDFPESRIRHDSLLKQTTGADGGGIAVTIPRTDFCRLRSPAEIVVVPVPVQPRRKIHAERLRNFETTGVQHRFQIFRGFRQGMFADEKFHSVSFM